MKATKTIPIVMTGTGLDPVRAGLIESLAHPGGNVTGLTTLNTELAGKRLELFKEAVPKLVRLAGALQSGQSGRFARSERRCSGRGAGVGIERQELGDAGSGRLRPGIRRAQ